MTNRWMLSLVAGTALIAVGNSANARVTLPMLLSDGMVFQRNMPVRIWGRALPGELVRVRFLSEERAAIADTHGRWRVAFSPRPAGGPFSIDIHAHNHLIIRDVLVGDVWVASGQSNMQWPVKGASGASIIGADGVLANANNRNVRLLQVHPASAIQPQADLVSNGWHRAGPSYVANFSAIAYLFAAELNARYHVPIGIIESDWPGSVGQAWMSGPALAQFQDFRDDLKRNAGFSPELIRQYKLYVASKERWYKRHERDDLGQAGSVMRWAQPNSDASPWQTKDLPADIFNCGKELSGFSGVTWYRKSVDLPRRAIGSPGTLYLGGVQTEAITFLNGYEIGRTHDQLGSPQSYDVPASLVRPGPNLIAVRVKGSDEGDLSGSCLTGPADQMRLQVGEVTVSLAGTWKFRPGADLSNFPSISKPLRSVSLSRFDPEGAFNAMINPLTAFPIKGVIWYQGESNVAKPLQYKALFPALIRDWRKHWGYNFPFLFVQLAGYGRNKPEPSDYDLAEFRDAQTAALSLPLTAMATAVDVGDESSIHPRNKIPVAHRLALAAAHVAYGENVAFEGPRFIRAVAEGDRVRIHFANALGGLSTRGASNEVRGFELGDRSGKFHFANARIEGQEVLVSAPRVVNPTAVRYSWENFPEGNVYSIHDLPMLPFRGEIEANPAH